MTVSFSAETLDFLKSIKPTDVVNFPGTSFISKGAESTVSWTVPYGWVKTSFPLKTLAPWSFPSTIACLNASIISIWFNWRIFLISSSEIHKIFYNCFDKPFIKISIGPPSISIIFGDIEE